MRTVVLVLAAALSLTCGGDRARPFPSEPTGGGQFEVSVMAPPADASVAGGQDLTVRIAATATGGGLVGLGHLVTRSAGGVTATIDSVVVRFAATSEATRDFVFRVPSGLPVNTQLDIVGLAFAADGGTRRSAMRAVIVIP